MSKKQQGKLCNNPSPHKHFITSNASLISFPSVKSIFISRLLLLSLSAMSYLVCQMRRGPSQRGCCVATLKAHCSLLYSSCSCVTTHYHPLPTLWQLNPRKFYYKGSGGFCLIVKHQPSSNFMRWYSDKASHISCSVARMHLTSQ